MALYNVYEQKELSLSEASSMIDNEISNISHIFEAVSINESMNSDLFAINEENFFKKVGSKIKEVWEKFVKWLKDLWAKIMAFFKGLFKKDDDKEIDKAIENAKRKKAILDYKASERQKEENRTFFYIDLKAARMFSAACDGFKGIYNLLSDAAMEMSDMATLNYLDLSESDKKIIDDCAKDVYNKKEMDKLRKSYAKVANDASKPLTTEFESRYVTEKHMDPEEYWHYYRDQWRKAVSGLDKEFENLSKSVATFVGHGDDMIKQLDKEIVQTKHHDYKTGKDTYTATEKSVRVTANKFDKNNYKNEQEYNAAVNRENKRVNGANRCIDVATKCMTEVIKVGKEISTQCGNIAASFKKNNEKLRNAAVSTARKFNLSMSGSSTNEAADDWYLY